MTDAVHHKHDEAAGVNMGLDIQGESVLGCLGSVEGPVFHTGNLPTQILQTKMQTLAFTLFKFNCDCLLIEFLCTFWTLAAILCVQPNSKRNHSCTKQHFESKNVFFG